jgi:glycosyltransferase involved in cell wall biosynthesis
MFDVVIPCLNEEETIGDIVSAFGVCPPVRSVIVVDNGSSDNTAVNAFERGATLRTCATKGKGQAIMAGMSAVTTSRVILCDGDLRGLRPWHVRLLCRAPFTGVVIGVPDFTLNLPWAEPGPVWNLLSGIRCLPSRLVRGIPELHGYCAEVQLNEAAFKAKLKFRFEYLDGVKGTPRPQDERIKAFREDGEWLSCKLKKTSGQRNTSPLG